MVNHHDDSIKISLFNEISGGSHHFTTLLHRTWRSLSGKIDEDEAHLTFFRRSLTPNYTVSSFTPAHPLLAAYPHA